jgi:hypothetical protein
MRKMRRAQLNLKQTIIVVIFCCVSVMLSGCARGLAYADVANRIPPVKAGYARVYFYSQNVIPSDLVFKYSIDGELIGKTGSFQTLFVDRPTGITKITANTGNIWPGAVPEDITLNLKSGQTRYIQTESFSAYFVRHIRLNIIDSDQALPDLARCFYVGPDIHGVPKV